MLINSLSRIIGYEIRISSEKKLVSFLRMILKTTPLVENYYQPWSYTRRTGNWLSLVVNEINILLLKKTTKGFNDALHSLDRLTPIDFHLPIDVSVRRFMNNRDLIE